MRVRDRDMRRVAGNAPGGRTRANRALFSSFARARMSAQGRSKRELAPKRAARRVANEPAASKRDVDLGALVELKGISKRS